MIMPQAPSSRRKHITSACASCRESKIKCDGSFPSCSSCRSKGKQCQYNAGDDKRRFSHRIVVELLSDRIDELCQFIRKHSLEPPPIQEEKQDLLMKNLGHLRLASIIEGKEGLIQNIPAFEDPTENEAGLKPLTIDFQNSENAHEMNSSSNKGIQSRAQPLDFLPTSEMNIDMERNEVNPIAQPSSENEVNMGDWNLHPGWGWPNFDLPLLGVESSDNTSTDILGHILGHPENPAPHPTLLPHDETVSGEDDSMETLVKQLSDRIGSLRIGSGGQVRYFGPTSNFNLVDMGPPDNLTVHRSVRDHGPEYLERLGMGKDVPQDLEDHLANLYFTWQDPAFHIVKRDMYEKAKSLWRNQQEDVPYYSESLQNSICCLGAAFEARYHPNFITFPKTLSDFFADRAKTLVEIEIDSPSIATVQALAILSSHDIGCKRDTRGWLYSGMATRLAYHLALHIDMTSHVTSGRISQEEQDLRRDVFWAAYTIDHIWSFHLGRAIRINMESVTVQHPDAEKSVEAIGQWIPYISRRSLEEHTREPSHTIELHKQRVLLCEIMAPLAFALYGNLRMPASSIHELNIVTVSKLVAWKNDLPLVLQVEVDDNESKYLPHVLLLHLLFYQNIIYAHRPWMSRGRIDTESYLGEEHNPEHARAMCIDAAVSIAKLLLTYERLYGLRRINIQAVGVTCSAALLLIFAIVVKHPIPTSSTDVPGPEMHLATCFRALEEFSAPWESAKKAREFLILLQRGWEHQARRLRDGHDTTSPDSTSQNDVVPKKRSRPREDSQTRKYRHSRPWSGQQLGSGVLDDDTNVDLDWVTSVL